VPPEEKETMIKKYKVFILGLVLACAPKPPELPKHYIPPESTEEDLEIEDALDMVEDLVQDTGETEENE
jgi:hypothetical protein